MAFEQGIYLFANGAGGDGLYNAAFFMPGEKGDLFTDDDAYYVTRINLRDARTAHVDVISFGKKAKAEPVAVAASLVMIRL